MTDVSRRAVIGGVVAVTMVGVGGTPERPAGYIPPDLPGVSAGSNNVVVARRVIIIGSGGELLVYSPSAGAGNLIASVAGAAFTDQYGNHGLQGVASYAAGTATASLSGSVGFYAGSLAGGWALASAVAGDAAGNLQVNAGGQLQLIGTAGVTIQGSANTSGPNPNATSTVGLPDGTIHGTSGGASAGTAHTHSPGTFAVGNGQHSHDTQNHVHPL